MFSCLVIEWLKAYEGLNFRLRHLIFEFVFEFKILNDRTRHSVVFFKETARQGVSLVQLTYSSTQGNSYMLFSRPNLWSTSSGVVLACRNLNDQLDGERDFKPQVSALDQ